MIGSLAQKASEAFGKWFGGTQPPPDGPPPPMGFAFEEVETWAREHLQLEGWIYLAHRHGGVVLASPVDPALRFQINIRVENFVALKDAQGLPCRSALMEMEVDARSRWMRLTAETHFRCCNLQEAYSATREPGEWDPIDDRPVPFIQHIADLCRQAEGFPPEAPASWLDSDVQAWTARTVVPGEDVYCNWDGEGAVYVRPSSIRRLSADRIALQSRLERFHPVQGFRSMLEDLELDRKRRSKKIVRLSAHAGHNLEGEAVTAEPGHSIKVGELGFREDYLRQLWNLADRLAPS